MWKIMHYAERIISNISCHIYFIVLNVYPETFQIFCEKICYLARIFVHEYFLFQGLRQLMWIVIFMMCVDGAGQGGEMWVPALPVSTWGVAKGRPGPWNGVLPKRANRIGTVAGGWGADHTTEGRLYHQCFRLSDEWPRRYCMFLIIDKHKVVVKVSMKWNLR